MKLLASMFLVLTLAACPKDAPPTNPSPGPGPGNNGGGSSEPADDWYACTVDEDCVAAELECCDACNGGAAVGVHRNHHDDLLADTPPGRGECGETMCTMMACAPWVPSCAAGKCTIERGSL